MHRADEEQAQALADKRLPRAGRRVRRRLPHNVIDLAPGTVMRVLDHPQREVGDDKKLLVLESRIDARVNEEMSPLTARSVAPTSPTARLCGSPSPR